MTTKQPGEAVADLLEDIERLAKTMEGWRPTEEMIAMYATIGPRLFGVQMREAAKLMRDAVARFETAVDYRRRETR